jgi:microcystin degradation protein MlrC
MGCIHVAGFMHETNTFASSPTDYRDFANCAFLRGIRRDAAVLDLASGPLAIAGFIEGATSSGHRVHPLLFAYAEAGGVVRRQAFDRVMAEMLSSIRVGPAPDAVFLDLHGAMVVEGIDDGESEILARIRHAVGSIPVVASFDLHGNISPDTLANVNVAAGYLTYPHVDMADRGRKLAGLVNRMLTGSRPSMAFRALPYFIPDQCQSTELEPARSLYDKVREIDGRQEIWSASLMAGFYQADVSFAGPSLFVYADDPQAAEAAADELEDLLLSAEPLFQAELWSVEKAVEAATTWSGTGPLLLADIQDNPGGGAGSDNVEILEALVARSVTDAAVGMICDPKAAMAAHSAGVGRTVRLELGGKSMPGQAPFTADFIVTSLNADPIPLSGPLAGTAVDVGLSAGVRIGGVHVVICSKPVQCLDRAYLRLHAIQPEEQRVIVLKSAAHYRADFSALAGKIIDVATNSACVVDATKLEYHKLRKHVRLSGLGPTLADLQAT